MYTKASILVVSTNSMIFYWFDRDGYGPSDSSAQHISPIKTLVICGGAIYLTMLL